MSNEANKQLVRDFFQGLSEGNVEKALATTSEDFRWTIIGDTPLSGSCSGHDEVLRFLGSAFEVIDAERGVDLELQSLVAEGDTVVAQVQGKAWGRNGLPYNNTYCHVFEVREGKIQADTEYLDTALVNQLMGS